MKFTIDKREEIDSTNLEVIRRAKTGAPEGTLVQAERQISGRGRRGRAWESPVRKELKRQQDLTVRLNGPMTSCFIRKRWSAF